MKLFGKTILIFCLVGTGLAYLLNYATIFCIHQIRTNEYGDLNKIVSGKLNSDILFLGSSRTSGHFNPTLIDKILDNGMASYNLGQDGEQLTVQVGILKSYLKYNNPPKIAVQGLDIFTASHKKDVVNKSKYFPYLNEPEIYQALSKIDDSLWLQKNIPLYAVARFNSSIINQFLYALGKKKYKTKGYYPRDESWNGEFEEFKKENPKGTIFSIDKAAIAEIEEIITLCRKNNIHLIFTYTPEFNEVKDIVLNRDKIIQTYVRIAEKYNIPFWDYSNDEISSKRYYFYNAMHLNAKGADIFSEGFAQKFKKYIHSMNLSLLKNP